MRGKQAKAARKMVADPVPATAVAGMVGTGRVSRGRVMRSLTDYDEKDNGAKSTKEGMMKRRPSVILTKESVRDVYQRMAKPWAKARASRVS